MSSADQLALRADQGSSQVPAFFLAPSYPEHRPQNTWRVRRAIVRARTALLRMQLDHASRAAVQLKRHLSEGGQRYSARYARALRTLEACILTAQDEPAAARSLLLSAPLAANDSLAAAMLRYLDWKCGECDERCAPDTVDYLLAPTGSKAVDCIFSLCLSAALAFDRLQLTVSQNLAREALQLARLRYGEHSPISGLPATLLAQSAYEQGRFAEAETLLRPRFPVILTSGTAECVARASVVLARLYVHRGRQRAAWAVLNEAEALGRARRWPRLVSIAAEELARVMENTREAGARGLRRRAAGSRMGALKHLQPWAEPRPSSQVRRAWTPADHEPRKAQEEVATFAAVEAALRHVCMVASQGSKSDGCALLTPWLRIGATSGLRMVFVDAGPPLLTLLEGLYHTLPGIDAQLSGLRPYIATLLRATAEPALQRAAPVTCRPLSHRETGVLRMIAHGMSNKRIAQALGITPETVKSHAKNIFLKLATRTRAQAVARAEASGFL